MKKTETIEVFIARDENSGKYLNFFPFNNRIKCVSVDKISDASKFSTSEEIDRILSLFREYKNIKILILQIVFKITGENN